MSILLSWILALSIFFNFGTIDILPLESEVSTVTVGTGFLINKNGYIASVAHIIENNKNFVIKYNNKWIRCKLVAVDYNKDVAIFKADIKTDQFLSLNTSFYNHSQVVVYGYPEPDYFGENLKVTVGEVTHAGIFSSYIWTDAITCPGNSGSPLIDDTNRVIGILQGGYWISRTGTANCMSSNFAIYIQDLINLATYNNISYSTISNNVIFNPNTVVLIEAW